jgi:hypothetical protein
MKLTLFYKINASCTLISCPLFLESCALFFVTLHHAIFLFFIRKCG